METNKVYNIHNGTMFARIDSGNGVFVYLTRNGLIYGIAYSSLCEEQLVLLENANAISLGLFLDEYDYSSIRLLPCPEHWATPNLLHSPLTINWLITNNCTQKCTYCYADDVINQHNLPENKDYKAIAKNILRLNPLNVVLSGGEPFAHPNISDIIKILSGKVGIIVDTNGINTDAVRKLAPLLAEHNIVIRISIDTFILKKEHQLRPSALKKTIYDDFNRISETIDILREHEICHSIQTVLTKINANDLDSMGDRLYKLGIHVWRIIPVQEASGKKEEIKKIKLDDSKMEYFIGKLKRKSLTHWKGMGIVSTSVKRVLNDVILVLPDGNFYTEGGYMTGKKVIDANSPQRPSMVEVNKKVDLREHFRRYLNAST